MRKEFNSHRISLEHQHGRRFIVLENQYGRRDVMWKRSIHYPSIVIQWFFTVFLFFFLFLSEQWIFYLLFYKFIHHDLFSARAFISCGSQEPM